MSVLAKIDGWQALHAAAGYVTGSGRLDSYGALEHAFRWASVTKLLTTYATLMAAEEGVLDLDTPLGPRGSTVRHLLAHASGLPFEGWDLLGRPGERRIYSNTGFEVLGAALADHAGMPFAAYVEEAVLRPLEMRATAIRIDEPRGAAAAGAYGSIPDLLTFARELLDPQLVAPETLAEATSVAFPGLGGVLPGFGRYDPLDWGLGFEIRGAKSPHWTGTRNSPRTFGHFGGSGTFLWVDPARSLALACLTDREFGEWAITAWPELSDAVIAALEPDGHASEPMEQPYVAPTARVSPGASSIRDALRKVTERRAREAARQHQAGEVVDGSDPVAWYPVRLSPHGMSDLRGWRWCPRCGAEIDVEGEAARCRRCGYEAYRNPAPAVCAVVLDGHERVLLGLRATEPERGKWDVLGGFVHWEEDPLDALRRELAEETGCEIEPLDYLGGFADRYGEDGNATLNLFWTARIVSGVPSPADDVAELRWFSLDRLPSVDEVAFASAAQALEALRHRLGEPSSPLGMFEVQLVTGDLERLEAFYRKRLRLKVSLRDGQRGRVHFRLRRGQLILALADGEKEAAPTWPGLPPSLLAPADPRGPAPSAHGPIHFAIHVDATQLARDCERLRSEGLDVRGPLRWPGGERSIYVRDPDGNVVELIAG